MCFSNGDIDSSDPLLKEHIITGIEAEWLWSLTSNHLPLTTVGSNPTGSYPAC
jgi:hypothetical protein